MRSCVHTYIHTDINTYIHIRIFVQSIRKTYEQIVKRLKEERVGFDNQLAAIERTLKAKEKDLEELVLMSHDAQHAKEVCMCGVCVLLYISASVCKERI